MSKMAKMIGNRFGSLGTERILAFERKNGRSVNYNGGITEVLSKYFCYVFGEKPHELVILHVDPDTEILSSPTVLRGC